jgi:hypothetical protein
VLLHQTPPQAPLTPLQLLPVPQAPPLS